MVRIFCHTNLDLDGEIWPEDLPEVPRRGDWIESGTRWKDNFRLQLEVTSVTWRCVEEASQYGTKRTWKPCVELHVPKIHNWSIRQFYEWYAPLVGRSVSAFL